MYYWYKIIIMQHANKNQWSAKTNTTFWKGKWIYRYIILSSYSQCTCVLNFVPGAMRILILICILLTYCGGTDGEDLDDCGKSISCFTRPTGCTSDCQASATWKKEGDKYVFEIAGKDTGYASLGLSYDQIMVSKLLLEWVNHGWLTDWLTD